MERYENLMKSIVLFVNLCLFSWTSVSSQSTERIYRDDYPYRKDSVKHEAVYQKWLQYAHEHPQDENAWHNLLELARTYDGIDGAKRYWMVQEEIKKNIPYTYLGYLHRSTYYNEREMKEKAYELLPDYLFADDYFMWVKYLEDLCDTTRMTDILQRYYDSFEYSPQMLRHDYNELQGMDKGGIIVGAEGIDIIGKLMLQFVMDVHKDKIVYDLCYNHQRSCEYNRKSFRLMDIPYPPDEEWKQWAAEKSVTPVGYNVLRWICRHSKRPVYLSIWNQNRMNFGKDMPKDIQKHLYNEGLLLRYSSVPYNNLKVKRRNYEERYMLEYLMMPFSPDNYQLENTKQWYKPSGLHEFLHIVHLSDLLPYYKRHDAGQYKRLNHLLLKIFERERKRNPHATLYFFYGNLYEIDGRAFGLDPIKADRNIRNNSLYSIGRMKRDKNGLITWKREIRLEVDNDDKTALTDSVTHTKYHLIRIY